MTYHFLLFLHLTSVIFWVGGMAFAYFCLRPAAAHVLEPTNRLPLWVDTFKHFLKLTTVAVITTIATGLAMLLQIGFNIAPVGWHIMLSLGMLMAFIFTYVYAVLYPRLHEQCKAATWPAAAKTLGSIRKMVALNLSLSVLVIAAAAFSR